MASEPTKSELRATKSRRQAAIDFRKMQMSNREAGELLGISARRVQQLVAGADLSPLARGARPRSAVARRWHERLAAEPPSTGPRAPQGGSDAASGSQPTARGRRASDPRRGDITKERTAHGYSLTIHGDGPMRIRRPRDAESDLDAEMAARGFVRTDRVTTIRLR